MRCPALKRLGDAGAPQGDARIGITLRLAGTGEAGREAVLEGLRGATRVEEVRRLGAALLGVRPALVYESRLLRDEETLAEAGVGAQARVEARVGDAGGMPGGFGLGGQQQLVDDLRVRVREAEARAAAEARRHAEAEARWKEELRKAEVRPRWRVAVSEYDHAPDSQQRRAVGAHAQGPPRRARLRCPRAWTDRRTAQEPCGT